MSQQNFIKTIFYTFLALPIGILTGGLTALFGRVLLVISDFRDSHINLLLPFLAAAGIFIIWLYHTFHKESMKGMGLIFSTAHKETEHIPLALIPLVMIATWITHLFGGSAGREGVAVQLGAALSHNLSQKINKLLKREDDIFALDSQSFVIIGMAAGFGGLFQTPLAAALFAVEILTVGKLYTNVLLPALAGAYTASFTSHLLGLEKFHVYIEKSISYTPAFIIKIIIMAIFFGIIGGSFAWLLDRGKKLAAKYIENPYKKIFLIGIVLSVLLFAAFNGRYCGLGTNLISFSFAGEHVYCFDWLLKFIFTILTLSAGFQGGEVTPLFSIGASLGIMLGTILGFPAPLAAALGYAAVFGSATNTFLAPAVIGMEVFGAEHALVFLLVCSIAYSCNGNQTIYGGQKRN